MCGLCGLFGNATAHWAETAVNGSGSEAPPVRAAGLRERLRRVAALRKVMKLYQIDVDDFAGSGWVVRGPTGMTEVVTGLDQVWAAGERVSRRKFDPLDETLVARMRTTG